MTKPNINHPQNINTNPKKSLININHSHSPLPHPFAPPAYV